MKFYKKTVYNQILIELNMKILYIINLITVLIITSKALDVVSNHRISNIISKDISNVSESKPKLIVCYYVSWAAYSAPDVIDKIDPDLCSHLIHAFANVKEDGIVKEGDINTDVTKG